jgi:hypothetical protein
LSSAITFAINLAAGFIIVLPVILVCLDFTLNHSALLSSTFWYHSA